jgi:molecular chaperone DnaK
MKKPVGIDLGTTFSEMAHITEAGVVEIIPNLDGELKTPSVISYASGKPVVGKAAMPDQVLAPKFFVRCSKRYIGKVTDGGKPIPICIGPDGAEITPVDAAAAILGYLKQSGETYLGCTVTDAVITVPAYFDPIARDNTKAAAKIAGFDNIRITDEPVAAALHYSLEKARQETVAVVDFGGGTLDVTAMEVNEGSMRAIFTDGDAELGGSNYDEAVLDHVVKEAQKDGLEISAQADLANFYANLDHCREAKEMLSRRDEVTIAAEAGGKRKAVVLTRDVFKTLVKPLDEKAIACCGRVREHLASKGKKIDRVLMVGGTSRLFHIAGLIKEVFGMEPSKDADPDFIVAKGAAVWAAKCFGDDSMALTIGGEKHLVKSIDMQTVAAHAICVAAFKSRSNDNREYNCPIVPANTTLPYEFEERFAPVDSKTTCVIAKFVIGEPDQLSNDCPVIREINIPTQPSDKHECRIVIRGKYTEEGTFEMTLVDELKGVPVRESFNYVAGLSKTDIDQKRRDFDKAQKGAA